MKTVRVASASFACNWLFADALRWSSELLGVDRNWGSATFLSTPIDTANGNCEHQQRNRRLSANGMRYRVKRTMLSTLATRLALTSKVRDA